VGHLVEDTVRPAIYAPVVSYVEYRGISRAANAHISGDIIKRSCLVTGPSPRLHTKGSLSHHFVVVTVEQNVLVAGVCYKTLTQVLAKPTVTVEPQTSRAGLAAECFEVKVVGKLAGCTSSSVKVRGSVGAGK
jgi:hypothetical protein